MDRPKIDLLFLVSTLERQAPTWQLYNIIKYLDYEKFVPSVLTLSPEPRDSLVPVFRRLGVSLNSLRLSRPGSVLMGAIRLREFITRHPLDIVHSCGVRADILSACIAGAWTRISTRRPALFEYTAMPHGPILGTMVDAVELWALRRLDSVVFLANDACQRNRRRWGLEGIVIRDGVDEGVFRCVTAQEKRLIRQRLGLPQDRLIFTAVGHLNKHKDPLTVLRGFLASGVAQRAVLVFVGEGPLRRACESSCDGRDNVRVVGRVCNVHEYLRAADVLISASLSEGLPNAVIEAAACGLPVVLSDIGPHRELLSLNPGAGKLFSVKNAKALARRLEDTTSEDYTTQSRAALQIVRDHLNARNMSAQYQDLYLECLKEGVNGRREK